jgi:hypothetical protein
MKLLRQQFLHLPAGVAGSAAFPAIAQERPSSAAGSSQTSLAETLARYAATLKYDDLPDDVVQTDACFVVKAPEEQESNVCFWHLTDIPECSTDVRFWG